MLQYTRKENQATTKSAFGFPRDNEQTACGAGSKHEVRVCELVTVRI